MAGNTIQSVTLPNQMSPYANLITLQYIARAKNPGFLFENSLPFLPWKKNGFSLADPKPEPSYLPNSVVTE